MHGLCTWLAAGLTTGENQLMPAQRLHPTELMQLYLTDIAQGGKLELIEQIAHADMVDEANQVFGGPPGRTGLVQHVVGFRKYIQDAEVDIRKIVAGDNDVMAWWRFCGTHAGPWLGRAPTGKRITGDVFSFFELQQGLVSRYSLWLHAGFDEPVIFDSAACLKSGCRPT